MSQARAKGRAGHHQARSSYTQWQFLPYSRFCRRFEGAGKVDREGGAGKGGVDKLRFQGNTREIYTVRTYVYMLLSLACVHFDIFAPDYVER